VSKRYSVVTFAYNEEKNIAAAIKSVLANCDERAIHFTVVANGCTDRTVDIAEQSVRGAVIPCSVLEIKFGDKCNAWNDYIYNHLPEADAHFFVDSDVTFTEKAFPKLFDELMVMRDMNAVTGLPQNGRNASHYVELATRYSCLFGNLYGLKDEFVRRMVEKRIRLPIGLNWIDAQITKLVNDNLEYRKNDYKARVAFLQGVGYSIESLKLWSLDDVRLYINRISRYKAGQLQEPYLDALPFVEWPNTMAEINQDILNNGVKYSQLGIVAPFRQKVLKRLRKDLNIQTGG